MSVYKEVNLRKQAQTERDPTRNDEVENNAGGFVFALSEWDNLDRFLVLGTEGGTYYSGARELTLDNVDTLLKLVESDGHRFVDRVVEISLSGRAPGNNPALFALAIAAAAKNPDTRSYALDNLNKVARIGTHLFHFVEYVQNLRGWGRSLRRGVSNWYLENDNDRLAYQVIKYRQRDGWSHRDVLRKAHPASDDPVKSNILGWVAGNQKAEHPQIQAFEEVQNCEDLDRVVELVTEYRLPWEAVPDQFMNEVALWNALLPNMGITALIRQLSRLTKIKLLTPLGSKADEVAQMLTDVERLQHGRVHPIQVLLAHRAYGGPANDGIGYRYSLARNRRGTTDYEPVPKILEALDEAFYLSFENVEPANKRTLMALDVSGSMSAPILGKNITAYEAAAAVAMMSVRTEPTVHTVAFSDSTGNRYNWRNRQSLDGITTVNLTNRDALDGVLTKMHQLGRIMSGTDCALPMLWAEANGVEVDTFQVITDNETWAGDIKPHQALKRYRQSSGIDAKLVVYGTTSNGFTIADPNDAGMLDIVGFDAAAPRLAADFSAGRIR